MFKWFSEFTDEELDAMPERVFTFEHHVYDIFLVLAMFMAMTYAGALVYVRLSLNALGFVPPNFIQTSPLVVLMIITCFMFAAGHFRDGLYGSNA